MAKFFRFFLSILTIGILVSCTSQCGQQKQIPPSGMAGVAFDKKEDNKPKKLLEGTVLIAIHKEGFSYLELKLKDGSKKWAAVLDTKAKSNDQVIIEEQAVLNNFESKSLKRTFDEITFGVIVQPKKVE